MPARSATTTLPITAPAMGPGDGPLDGDGKTDEEGACDASGPVEEETCVVAADEIREVCEASEPREEDDCEVGVELMDVSNVDVTLLSGVVIVESTLDTAVVTLEARLLRGTNVTV